MKKCLLIITTLLCVNSIYSQILWTENFDGYTTGTFTTGQGGWDIRTDGSDVRIITEPGRGNVLAWGWNQFPLPTNYSAGECEKKGIAALWNTRTAGNNVLKLEFDFYSKDFTDAPGQLFQASVTFDVSASVFHCVVRANESYIDTNVTYPSAGNYKTAYNHTWIKVEVYIEYNAGTNTTYVCTYVPLLNYLGVHERKAFNILNSNALFLRGNVGQIYKAFMGALVKYDNFKLSAIPTLPTHISVGVNEQLAQKFNMYPNPATNVVNITNTENMLVQQITVYDIAGKQLSTQSFNNDAEIQLNVENLASGTYMLHLQTAQGTAVKKLVKK